MGNNKRLECFKYHYSQSSLSLLEIKREQVALLSDYNVKTGQVNCRVIQLRNQFKECNKDL